MTPLAHRLAKELIAGTNPNWSANKAALRESLYGIHCFECTAILPLLNELSIQAARVGEEIERTMGRFGFLPAPKTWIEFIRTKGERIALLAEQSAQDEEICFVTLFWDDFAQPIGTIHLKTCTYDIPDRQMIIPQTLADDFSNDGIDPAFAPKALISMLQGILTLINTPRIIGRRQVMPHVGLERKLVKKFGAGKFPLQAWTEIKLQVAKPIEIDDGLPHEAHLTGKRALHFCRAHLRVQNGQLVYVSSHWRGDAAIGIKQSRYVVQ